VLQLNKKQLKEQDKRLDVLIDINKNIKYENDNMKQELEIHNNMFDGVN